MVLGGRWVRGAGGVGGGKWHMDVVAKDKLCFSVALSPPLVALSFLMEKFIRLSSEMERE